MTGEYLFDRKSDSILLSIPFFFLILAILELFEQIKFSTFDTNLINFAAKIILFNHVHVFFTFCLALWHPDIKNLMRQKTSLAKKKIITIFILLFFIFLVLNFFLQPHQNDNIILKILLLFISFLGLHHNYTQSLGLSLIYNTKKKLRMNDFNRWVEKIERYSIYILLVSQFSYMAFLILNSADSIETQVSKWIMFISAITAYLSAYLYRGDKLNSKRIFMIRYLLYPLIPFSFIALIGVLALHGIEYFYVFKILIARSSQKVPTQSIQLMILTIALLTIVTITDKNVLGWYFTFENKMITSALLFIGAASTAMSYLHYYIDSQLFRMSDPDTSKVMSRLIT